MTRIGVGSTNRLMARLRHVQPPRALPDLSTGSPTRRIGLVQAAAVAVCLAALALDRPSVPDGSPPTWILIALGFSALRTVSVGRRLAVSTVVLDALGVSVFLAGTGGPVSPFFLLALAGVWWAAHMQPSRSGILYAGAFVVGYLVLVAPTAVDRNLLAVAIEDLTTVLVVAVLADSFVRVDRRALALNDALYAVPFGAEQLAIREGLMRALKTMDIPVDVIITAGQVGLTAIQAELLCYLVLGLTNLEISDAAGVSESTVRYRLTKLYRALGVRSRREAALRARELGLSDGAERPSA